MRREQNSHLYCLLLHHYIGPWVMPLSVPSLFAVAVVVVAGHTFVVAVVADEQFVVVAVAGQLVVVAVVAAAVGQLVAAAVPVVVAAAWQDGEALVASLVVLLIAAVFPLPFVVEPSS